MKWVETIEVRLTSPRDVSRIRKIFGQVEAGLVSDPEKPITADLLTCSGVETDWCVRLHRGAEVRPPAKTRLGLNLAEAFRSLGLVKHTVWVVLSSLSQ